MDVACPSCGNPNLDVDAANSVVFCKKCGFAVRVDPNTGETTPLSPGNAGGAAPASAGGAPAAYRGGGRLLGMEPFNFWIICTVILLVLTLMQILPDLTTFAVAEIVVTILWLFKR